MVVIHLPQRQDTACETERVPITPPLPLVNAAECEKEEGWKEEMLQRQINDLLAERAVLLRDLALEKSTLSKYKLEGYFSSACSVSNVQERYDLVSSMLLYCPYAIVPCLCCTPHLGPRIKQVLTNENWLIHKWRV